MAKRTAHKAAAGGTKKQAAAKSKNAAAKAGANGSKRSGHTAKARAASVRRGKRGETGRGDPSVATAEAGRLFDQYIKAGMAERSDEWPLYMWPKELAATPAAKRLLSATIETQIEVVRLAAADLARGRRCAPPTPVLLNTLLRRALPLPPETLLALARAAAQEESFKVSSAVLATFLERWFKAHAPDDEVLRAVAAYRDSLDAEHHRKERQRLNDLLDAAKASAAAARSVPVPSMPAAALDRVVEEPVRALPANACAVAEVAALGKSAAATGMRGGDASAQSTLERALLHRQSLGVGGAPWLFDAAMDAMVLPPEGQEDGVVSFAADRLGVEGPILAAIADLLGRVPARYCSDVSPLSGSLLRALNDDSLTRAAAAAAACAAAMSHHPIRYGYDDPRAQRFHNGVAALIRAVPRLLHAAARHKPPPAADDLAEAFHSLSRLRDLEYIRWEWGKVARVAAAAAAPVLARGGEPSARLLLALLRLRERIARCVYERSAVREFDAAFGIAPELCVDLGERWSDRMYLDLRAMPAPKRAAWEALLLHCSMASGGQPSGKWLRRAAELRERIGPASELEPALASWFSLVGKARPAWPGGKVEGRDSSVPSDRAADVLKGLAWSAAAFNTPRMAQALGDLAMACYKMVPGVGARCIKPGTAAVWALSQMTIPEALGQISRVRQLVKFGTAKKVLDSSLERLAEQLNMTTDELHEVAVPDFGLERGGVMREEAGDFTIELAIEGSSAEVRILGEDGAARQSVPESVKREHKETLAAVKQAAADIDKMLAAQKDRLERLYHDQRTWPAALWRARYLDHPLVGALAGRLIWSVTRAGRTREMIPLDGRFVDARGEEVELRDDDTVSLWHPIVADPSQVLAWREFLEERQVRQPFKQAHREIYPLTDAERRTRTYSNRFAAHIVRQGPLHTLCQQRGWRHALHVMDSGEPPMLHLPKWNLYAHYLVQPIGDETYGTVGAYAYLETDQVAFSRTPGGENIPLEEVPPLVLSEVMRDVDLFVAVASVGNNPDWEDGGPDGRFRNYWWEYGFGDLAESGRSRRDALARLLPRLRIAAACTLEERFLRVRGSLREYKIHLGSGNILMEPDDTYLCIVPRSRDELGSGKVFLPFEGDRVLAIILSKAFMLADDDKIKDPTIVSQIRRR